MRERYVAKSIIIQLLLLIALSWLMISCQSAGEIKEETEPIVRMRHRLPLKTEEGPNLGVYSAKPFTLDYQYDLRGNRLEIAGVVRMADEVKIGYTSIEKFFLSIHYIDPAGRLIGDSQVMTRAKLNQIMDLTFNRALEIPPQTTAITFGYTLEVEQAGWPRNVWTYREGPIR